MLQEMLGFQLALVATEHSGAGAQTAWVQVLAVLVTTWLSGLGKVTVRLSLSVKWRFLMTDYIGLL